MGGKGGGGGGGFGGRRQEVDYTHDHQLIVNFLDFIDIEAQVSALNLSTYLFYYLPTLFKFLVHTTKATQFKDPASERSPTPLIVSKPLVTRTITFQLTSPLVQTLKVMKTTVRVLPLISGI